jgi:hypothetical protein
MSKDLSKPTFEDLMAMSQDIFNATDAILSRDFSRTALPNRILYDLVRQMDRSLETQVAIRVCFTGPVSDVALDLISELEKMQKLDQFGAVLKQGVADAGGTFSPSFKGWQNKP